MISASENSTHLSADSGATPPEETGLPMRELLARYPGAQRALFRRYHLGGCSSCAIQPDETLTELCQRNALADPAEVLESIRQSHEQDRSMQIDPAELKSLRATTGSHRLLDIRTREEFDSVRIDGAVFFNQDVMQEILGRWPRDERIIIYDHKGLRALDAAAYFLGQGFPNTRALRGGIDAWSLEIDPAIPRYELEHS